MKDWPALSTDEELERADFLLDQADALLGRRRDEVASTPSVDDDDLPILTDIVDEHSLSDMLAPAAAPRTAPAQAEAAAADAGHAEDAGPLWQAPVFTAADPAAGPDADAVFAPEFGDDAEDEADSDRSPPWPADPLLAKPFEAAASSAFEALEDRPAAAPDPATAANSTDTADADAALPAATDSRDGKDFTEVLIELDTRIARSIEEWMDREFPQFLARELSLMQTRLHRQLHDHLNATLLSEISAHISEQLGQRLNDATTRRD